MKFIGIDLGWTTGFSGLCCLNWDHNQLTLLDLTRFQPIEKVLHWIDSWVSPTESALIAVDAPTLMVHLFRLSAILKYKKGRLVQRKAELIKLRHYILEVLPQLTPRLT
jgi:predicted RNase H-like nuclease